MTDADLDAAIALVKQVVEAGGPWYALAAAVVVVVIRVLRSSPVQSRLPGWLRWAHASLCVRLSLVLITSAAAAFVTATLNGDSWWRALIASIGVAISAVLGHEATRAVGYAHTSHALKQQGPFYEPGSIRTVLSPVFPIDRQRMYTEQAIIASAMRERNQSAS